MCLPPQSQSMKQEQSSFSTNSSCSQAFSVPTFPERQHTSISVLVVSDMASLKSADPFMYYSILTSWKAAMRGNASPSCSLFESDASQQAHRASYEVTRQSRLSTESHPSLLLEDIMPSILDFTSPMTAVEVNLADLLDDYLNSSK